MIQTVKLQGQGYLLNEAMSVPKADGNREYELIKQWLSEGNIPEPEFTEEELAKIEADRIARETKEAKELALATITVEVNGKVFDGNEKARLNMLSAIQASSVVGIESTYWKLADNTAQEVTVDELKQALALSIQRVGEIIV